MVHVLGAAHKPGVPNDFRLVSASPNPFNNSVTLRFELDQPGDVQLGVFDLMGRKMLSQLEFFEYGNGAMTITSGQLGSAGIYFARVSVGNQDKTIKLICLP